MLRLLSFQALGGALLCVSAASTMGCGALDGSCDVYAGTGCEGAADEWSTPTCEDQPSGLAHFAYGEDTKVHGGASRSCSAVVPLAEPNVLLAICDDALYVSTDAGCSLELIDDGCRYQALTAAPEYGGYATCTDLAVDNDQLVSITPGELSFTETPDRLISNIVVDPNDREHVLLMNIQEQFYRTDDGGETWQAQPLATASEYPGVRDAAIDVHDIDHFVYTDWDHVYRTTDGGGSYEMATLEFDGSEYQDAYVSRLAASPAHPNLVFALGRMMDEESELIEASHGLYRSNDGGLTFVHTDDPVGDYDLFVHPEDPEIYYFLRAEGGDGADDPPTHSSLIRVEDGEPTTIDSTALISTIAFSPADPELFYLALYDTDW